MRTFLTLLSREIKSYFYSPIAYVVMFFFLCATGFDFFSGVSMLNRSQDEGTVVQATFTGLLFWIPFLLIFPLITKRTYSDEFRMGTFETVLTAPVRDWEVVLAKFFGALFFYCVLWLPSVSYFAAFQWLTGKEAAVAAGAFWGSYLLLLLIGMFYISIGCLASALTTEQINAAIMTFVLIFMSFILPLLPGIVKTDNPAMQRIASYFCAPEHMWDFSRGIVDSRPIVWYLSITTLILVVNFQIFQYRKWKA